MNKMNKKGFGARDYLIGLLIFSGAIALFYLAVNSMAGDDTYGNVNLVDPEFNESFNKLNDNIETSSGLWDATTNSSGLSLIDTGEILLSSTFSAVNLLFGSFSIVNNQVSSIGAYFGVDNQIMNIILALFIGSLVIIIIILIINAVNKTERL